MSAPNISLINALPQFTFHPDPVGNGVIIAADVVCVCCGLARGAVYIGHVSCADDLNDQLCPWCISDGTAAAKLGASFNNTDRLSAAGVPGAVTDEIALRTPGYLSYQAPTWLSHCGDACEFHGDAPVADITEIAPDTKAELLVSYTFSETNWNDVIEGYRPGGDPAFYKFVCRHCRAVRLEWDCS
jgi:uncharacterized protein CbrC (UPF0167 family)